MMYPSSAEDDQSLATTSYTYRGGSTRANDSNPSRYPQSMPSTIRYKSGRPTNVELLLRLFEQRRQWSKYGNLKVVCYEAFIFSPVKLWWLMAEIFVLTTVMVFAYEFFFVNWVILVPAVIVAILEWMAFYKTCMRDPGVMPRPPFVDAVKNLVSVLSTWSGGPGTKRLVAHPNGHQEELHYCWRCHHFRSFGTSHCGNCDCCMILHDHHCPVYGGCVAKNNISSFHTMIISMGLFWLYMIGMCIYNMTVHIESAGKSSGLDGTPLTFYLIMAEIMAVFIIPVIVSCVTEMFCKPSRNLPEATTASKPKAGEILQFAQNNNFTLQERMQLMEILQVQDSFAEEGRIGSQDLNHNNFFAGAQAT